MGWKWERGHLQHYFCSVGPGVCVAWLIVVLGSVASGSLFLCEAIFPSSVGGGLELLEVQDGLSCHRCCCSVRPGECVVLLCCIGSVVLGALYCAAEAFSPISQKLPIKKGPSVRWDIFET